MAWERDGYSRLIQWLKILLPLAALGLLSTVFLLSRPQEATQDLPYRDIEIGPDGLTEGVLEPSFAGATQDGDLIAFTADVARPLGAGADRLSAEVVRARIDLHTGGFVTFSSDTAEVDQRGNTATLQGGVVIISSTGYTTQTEELTTSLDGIAAESAGEIRGEGPVGRFVAGGLKMSADDDGGNVHLLFTGGVKLVYDPRSD